MILFAKSTDDANKIMKHLVDRGEFDVDGVLHDVKVAWRALAMAQKTAERVFGYPPSRASRNAGTAAGLIDTTNLDTNGREFFDVARSEFVTMNPASDRDVAAVSAPGTPPTVPTGD